jgi:hypothetical protein
MPKVYLRDKLLFAVDKARRAHKNNKPILVNLMDNNNLGEVIQKNLD